MEAIELKSYDQVDFITSMRRRMIKSFRKPSIDFVEILPKKVNNKIFGFCSGYDLLNFSLVNRKWYKFIGKSAACMDRLKITISEPKIGSYQLLTMTDSFFLTQHGRKYVHISLASMERQLLAPHKLLLAYFQLKTVALNNHTFKSKMEFVNFLGILEPFVEELTLRCIKYGKTNYEIGMTNFKFPKLTKLSIINCYTFVYSEPFRNVTNLKYFNVATDVLPYYVIDSNSELVERVKAIQTILLNNIDIHILELFIHQKDFDAMFMDQRFLKRIKFNLLSLYAGRFKQQDHDDINIVQINNFVEFLKSQEQTLANLYLENWLGNATLEYAVNDMQLQDLTIANMESFGNHDESIADLSLYSNDTIEHLTLWSQSARHHFVAAEILKVCRALRVLEIRTINQPILDAIIENNEDIEIIVCDFFSAYIVPERAVMRNLSCMIINVNCADNFRDLIGVKDNYTNFEMLFLKAAKQLKIRWNMTNLNFYRY